MPGKILLFFLCLIKRSAITSVVRDVAISRHFSLLAVVLSPGRTKSSHSSLHSILCQSKRTLLRIHPSRDPLIWAICLCAFLGEYKKNFSLCFLSFSGLWDSVLSHILRIWTSRNVATLTMLAVHTVLPFQMEKSHTVFHYNDIKGGLSSYCCSQGQFCSVLLFLIQGCDVSIDVHRNLTCLVESHWKLDAVQLPLT